MQSQNIVHRNGYIVFRLIVAALSKNDGLRISIVSRFLDLPAQNRIFLRQIHKSCMIDEIRPNL